MSNASLELGGDNWAAKDGNLLGYAVGDSSGKYVPREFTFTRGSNLAATRVAANGLIEKGRENLLLQSNQFDTTWTLSSTSVTSGQAGYDGSSDAWLLNSTTTGFPRIAQNVSSSGVATYSVYAKPATDGFILMRTFGADSSVWFDLTNGTIPNAAGSQYITSNIQSVGNGWYRCSVIVNGSLTSLRIYPASAYGVYSTSGNGVYIQDAQLEAGMVATDYIETGASTVKAGILENTPRLDYSGGATEPSLLLEPSRTNLITQSEYLDSHSKNASTLVNFSSVTCPIQGVKVSQIIDSNSGGNGRLALFQGVNLTASTTYTASIFAKADQLNFIYFSFDGAAVNSDKRVWFNLSTGQVGTESGGATGTIESFGDGWYRCIMVFTADNTGIVNTKIAPAEEDNNINVDRDGTSSVFATAMQLEEGSYPTSYTPNHSGGSVTRSADSFQNDTNTSPLNQNTQGTWFVELQKLGDDTNQALYLAPMTSNTQQIRLHFDASNARFRDAVNGYATIGGGINVKTSMTKMALSIDTTSGIAKVYANGSQLGSDYTLQSNPFEFSRIVAEGKGFILKQSLFFPIPLSDAELATLTTL